MAYPGSQLYTQAVREKWPLPETWSGYAQYSPDTLPLPTKYLSGPDVLRFRDEAFRIHFTSPRYLDMAARKFGAETARHVQEMASNKLERFGSSILLNSGADSEGWPDPLTRRN